MGTSRFEPVSDRCACGAVAYRVTAAATALYVTGVILDDAKLQHSFADCEEERAALTATA